MTQHLIDHHLQPQGMRLVQHAVKIRKRAKQRVHTAKISDVIAKISHRRSEEWRDPNRVDTE